MFITRRAAQKSKVGTVVLAGSRLLTDVGGIKLLRCPPPPITKREQYKTITTRSGQKRLVGPIDPHLELSRRGCPDHDSHSTSTWNYSVGVSLDEVAATLELLMADVESEVGEQVVAWAKANAKTIAKLNLVAQGVAPGPDLPKKRRRKIKPATT